MAVARCCLQRAFAGFSASISNKFTFLAPDSYKSQASQSTLKPCSRPYSINFNTMYTEDLKGLPDYEVLQSPPQWKYVERLLMSKTIPKPVLKEEYPSGWVPQNPDCLNQPYYVPRNKNHMVPVHLQLTFRGLRKITIVKKVQGDIWLLAEEMKAHLKAKNPSKIVTFRVHELCGHIEVKGDFYYDVIDYLLEKGF